MKTGSLFWGVILILLGGLFFLQSAGLIHDVFGWFWPLVLIMLGIWVLGSRYLPRSARGGTGETFSIDLKDARRLNVDFDHGAGSVFFGGGAPAGVAISGSQGSGLEVRSELAGENLGVELKAGPSFLPFIGPEGGEWRFNLTQEVPVAIKVDAGASSLEMDLTDIKLAFLGIDTGASIVRIKLPVNAGHTLVDIESGAASFDLQVPQGVGARIRFEQGASSMNIAETRFPRMSGANNLYQSADYDSAANKVEINLDGGANSVKIS